MLSFFVLLSRVVFIRDAGEMQIVEKLVDTCGSFRLVVMTYYQYW